MKTERNDFAACASCCAESKALSQGKISQCAEESSVPFRLEGQMLWAVRAGATEARHGGKFEDIEAEGRRICGMLHVNGLTYFVVAKISAEREVIHCESSEGGTWEALSEREVQIAVLVSRGKGTKQIAGRLQISEHTVRSYMRRIFSKLHVSSRPAMVAKLMKAGILCAASADDLA